MRQFLKQVIQKRRKPENISHRPGFRTEYSAKDGYRTTADRPRCPNAQNVWLKISDRYLESPWFLYILHLKLESLNSTLAVFHGIDLPETTDNHTVQFVADNADHNAATIDGQNMFHGMEMIAVVTHGVSKPKKIPRKKVTMQDVQASNFVIRVYGKGIVVFDGYNNEPSTKDKTHLRRTNGCSGGPDICFSGDMLLCETKQRFLMNSANKQRFIKHLIATFRENGFERVQAPGDADCLIVKTALEKASESQTVVGEDTDLLLLLLFHVSFEHRNVPFTSSSKKSGSKVWDIKAVQDAFEASVCRNILFAHAIGGSDTTSSLFTIGKSLPLRKVQESQALDTLRHVKDIQKLSICTTTLQPNKLPPTIGSSAVPFSSDIIRCKNGALQRK